MSELDPTVRGQELGAVLRELREHAGFTMVEAGERIGASASKLSRMENGKRPASTEDVAALLAVYRIVGPRRTELLELARRSGQRGWWLRDQSTFTERQQTLISLESRAWTITNFEALTIPGLLQTGEYTRALMIECGHVPDDEVEHRMLTRMRRHSVLLRQRPPGVAAIIDEFALRRVIGGQDVQRRQLEHLLEMGQRANVAIRVVPNAGHAHAGINGSFAVIRRFEGPPVVFLENLTSSLFLEERPEIQRYEYAVTELLRVALEPVASLEHIAALAARFDPGE